MHKRKHVDLKKDAKNTSPFNDPNMNLWVLLDQTRDIVARARELELNHYKLTRVQASMLFILISKGNGLTISDISNWNIREPHSILSLINRMEKIGLVKKSYNKEEGKLIVTATEKGRDTYLNASRLSIEMIFSVLNDEEKEQLTNCLKKVRAKGRELLGVDFKPPFLP